MRSKWIEHQGKQIFFQDFSGIDLDKSDIIKDELVNVQKIVTSQPEDSILILADFRGTTISKNLMDVMQASSSKTKKFVHKTAVLGVTGTKRILANMLMSLTGQKLSIFENEEEAKEWLVQD
ncbi:MAG: hypothetical protein CVU44_00975 [Chloroflexi bacterium HGW-Chloroflexi-6]|nr:MAG: hypothetical protein CVU44_00975 [Chloroflexi bacterium HGW-Chloroflexi-6]